VRSINYSDKIHSYIHKKWLVTASYEAATATVKILMAENSTTNNTDDDANTETNT